MNFKKIALMVAFAATPILALSVAEAQYNQTTCTTNSQGLYYQETDYNYNSAASRVVNNCKAHPRTINRECEMNVRCSGQPQPPYPPYPGYASISAYLQNCYSDLCTYQISWRTGYGNSSVVTVQIPGETPEKLMSCEGASGTASASWVAPGKTYIFRMYASTRCTADVGRYENPAAVVNVYGGQR